MTDKYTPWHGDVRYSSGRNVPLDVNKPVYGVFSNTLGDVAYISNVSYSEDDARANARLIAAAPDLLEACVYALEALETMENIDRTVLEQAILKARGEA